ncbi:MAG TPA: iron-sulfur cluster biosynthesis family protein [Thermoanaerobaculia bacterium]|nr:iron-sulfur cluster biosynthesis family protein [Thermoanaerobaculia bacterium]
MKAPSISLEPDAARHLAAERDGRVLRIAFTTGCGGSGYRLSFEATPREDDVLVRDGELVIALDDMSAKNLDGAVIRYNEDEDGYTLDHPDAVAAVWCG